MANEKLRKELKRLKIPYWQIASILGIHENTVMRKLRFELSDTDKAAFEKAISEITANEQSIDVV
ncbi:MAG: hypothetical protein J5994_08185 [Ruminococcus sp.]|nr:hypothetical protein [Ruminococcus sp.]